MAGLLTAWITWLRAPTFGTTLWNIDEGISAVVARTLLEGNVMYRDVVDHRTPLSYYATAGLFRFTGVSMTALHVLVAGLVAATATGLFLLGRRTREAATGLWAACIYSALACFLLTPSDAYAAHTEWFVALFTTAAAVVFWSTPDPTSLRRSVLVGALVGLAFLSKQTGLVELGAPLGTLLFLGLTKTQPWRRAARGATGIALGFSAVVGSTAAAFALLGAWRDVSFYTWVYNTRYYGPETTWGDRVLAPGPFFAQLATLYPLVFVLGLLSAIIVAVRLVQLRPSNAQPATQGWECYLLLWCGASLASAMASGRSFDHYFIQCLPSFAWMAAWVPGWLSAHWRTSSWSPVARGSAAILLTALAVALVWTPLAARKVAQPPEDPAWRLSDFIRTHSVPDDKIFVWGYNADIYLYADRAPASRFVYCTFQTGLIPWTNLDPATDTTYAIVPGSMEALISDLSKHQPRFIVDCGVGPHRRFTKYPLAKFDALRKYVEAHYVEVDPDRYRAQGFRLFIRNDAALTGTLTEIGATVANAMGTPSIQGPSNVSSGHNLFTLDSETSNEDLKSLALFLDGRALAAVHFAPSRTMRIQVPVFVAADGPEHHRLQAVSTLRDGRILLSEPKELTRLKLNTEQTLRAAFGLPKIAETIPADGVRALINPRVDIDTGERVFNLHAPSLLTYSLPAAATVLRGRFGIPAGAYAPDNRAPTDGAEFIVRVIDAAGASHVLYHRLLNPANAPNDRPIQTFRVEFKDLKRPLHLELEITAGPAGVPSSDWTFWSDLVLETTS